MLTSSFLIVIYLKAPTTHYISLLLELVVKTSEGWIHAHAGHQPPTEATRNYLAVLVCEGKLQAWTIQSAIAVAATFDEKARGNAWSAELKAAFRQSAGIDHTIEIKSDDAIDVDAPTEAWLKGRKLFGLCASAMGPVVKYVMQHHAWSQEFQDGADLNKEPVWLYVCKYQSSIGLKMRPFVPNDGEWRDMYIIASILQPHCDEVFVPFLQAHLVADASLLSGYIATVMDFRNTTAHGKLTEEELIQQLVSAIDAIRRILESFSKVQIFADQPIFTRCARTCKEIGNLKDARLVASEDAKRLDQQVIMYESDGSPRLHLYEIDIAWLRYRNATSYFEERFSDVVKSVLQQAYPREHPLSDEASACGAAVEWQYYARDKVHGVKFLPVDGVWKIDDVTRLLKAFVMSEPRHSILKDDSHVPTFGAMIDGIRSITDSFRHDQVVPEQVVYSAIRSMRFVAGQMLPSLLPPGTVKRLAEFETSKLNVSLTSHLSPNQPSGETTASSITALLQPGPEVREHSKIIMNQKRKDCLDGTRAWCVQPHCCCWLARMQLSIDVF